LGTHVNSQIPARRGGTFVPWVFIAAVTVRAWGEALMREAEDSQNIKDGVVLERASSWRSLRPFCRRDRPLACSPASLRGRTLRSLIFLAGALALRVLNVLRQNDRRAAYCIEAQKEEKQTCSQLLQKKRMECTFSGTEIQEKA
jgi:hypothetical protein